MPIDVLVPSGQSSPDGLAYDVAGKVDELVEAVNATDTISTLVPDAAIADLGATADLSAIVAHTSPAAVVAHTASGAIDAVFDDLADARGNVDALRTDVEAALDEIDATLDTLQSDAEVAFDEVDATLVALRADTEARLDDIEAKVDEILAMLRTVAIIET